MKSYLGLFVFLSIFLVGAVFASSDLPDDYFGYLAYSSNETYYFYLNSTSESIYFVGANESNNNQSIEIPYYSNEFKQRINYGWYQGWFDSSNLYLNEYVPAEISYSQSPTEVNGTYSSSFLLDIIPLVNMTNVSLTVVIDTVNNISIIESLTHPELNSNVSLYSVFNDSNGPHFYSFSTIALETRLTPDKNVELHLWFKDDFWENGLAPHWISPLTSIHAQLISLISPSDNQVFEITGNTTTVSFEFLVNSSLFIKSNFTCFIDIANNLIPSYPDENLTHWTANSSFELGEYDWRVSCTDSLMSIESSYRSFEIREFVAPEPIVKPKEEEGGRRRIITLPLENLSLNTTESEVDSSNNPISFITGAVIGTFGEKGTFIIGLLMVIIGLATLVVYNREHLGLVKKEPQDLR